MKVAASRFLSLFVIAAMMNFIWPGISQDLVQTESLTSGSSVFVFRQSRLQRSAALAGGRVALRSDENARGARGATTIARNSQKKRVTAIKEPDRTAVAASNRNAVRSQTLTRTADDLLAKDNIDGAIANYRSALAANPQNKRAQTGLSSAMTAKAITIAGEDNDRDAVPLLEEAIKYDGSNDAAYAKLGAVFEANGEPLKAAEKYEKAAALNAEHAILYGRIGLIRLNAGEVALAETALQRSDAANVDSADSRFLRGLIHFKQNRDAEALAAFERAAEFEERFAEANFYRGQVLDRMGRNDQAVAAYRTTLKNDPAFTPAAIEMGNVFLEKGENENAVAALDDAAKREPQNAEIQFQLGNALRLLERFAEAGNAYQRASVTIRTVDLYSNWGYSLGRAGDWANAAEKLKVAAEINPAGIEYSNVGWAYYNAGYAIIEAADKDPANQLLAQARTYLVRAVELDRTLAAAFLNLGSTHNALGEFDDAIRILQTALSLRRDWLIAMNQLGLGYRGLRDFKNAIATLKRAVEIDPRYALGLYNLGESYFASGNKSEAQKIQAQLRRIDPSLATRLESVIAGRMIDAGRQQIERRIRIPRPF
ncbi:MAG: tetratricopeptide repeat protein [Acidobacteriota bacterium]|nr:MAG: tetratricopeptide repeat protein [Acidobacteriota bacterium]